MSFLDKGIQMEVFNTCLGEVEIGESHKENYEAELIDGETTSVGVLYERKPCRKKIQVNNIEPLPGER